MAAADTGVDHGGDVTGAGQVPLGDGPCQDLARVQARELGGAQRPGQPLLRVAVQLAGSRGERRLEQRAVAPFAGGRGLGCPHRVQDGQVVGVGQGLPPRLRRGLRGPVAAGDHLRENAYGAGRLWVVRVAGGGGVGVGGEAVVAGELGRRAGAGDRVGQLGRRGENVGGVVVGAAGQGDVDVLAVLAAGEHCQADPDGAALGDMRGDRVAELGILVVRVQELSVRPAAPPALPVGAKRAADEEALSGDCVDAEQVAVGQGPPRLPSLDVVVVAGAHDQVAGAGRRAARDGHGLGGVDEAEAE